MKKVFLAVTVISALALTGCAKKAGNLTVLRYKVSQQDNISTKDRAKVHTEAFIKEEMADKPTLTNTCMGAAKYMAQQTSAQYVDMNLYDQPGTGEGHVLLATCKYAADGKGEDGKSNWTWKDLTAAKDTTRVDIRNVAKEMGKFPRRKGESDQDYYDRIGEKLSFGVFEVKKIMSYKPVPEPVTATAEQEAIEPIPETLKDGILN